MPETATSAPPVVDTTGPPTLRTEIEILTAANELAETVAAGAQERDRDHELPIHELELLRASGLLTISIPREYGGPGAANRVITEVFRLLAQADPALAQIPQPHFGFVDVIGRYGTPTQKAFFFGEVLRGARIGNAVAERGGAHALDTHTRINRLDDRRLVLNGRKYYSTGAVGADWIAVLATDVEGRPRVAMIPGVAEGLETKQDWSAFGQRSTISGTTILEDVPVPENHVIGGLLEPDTPADTSAAFTQILHAAIDVGIAGGALADAVTFVKHKARPWHEAGVTRAADDPQVALLLGRIAVRVHAAEAMLERAADALDRAAGSEAADDVAAARIAVGEAKAFGGETAVEVSSGLFDLAGTTASDARYGLDRHWRNARVHTLHDPGRWKHIHIGRQLLTGELPAADNHAF